MKTYLFKFPLKGLSVANRSIIWISPGLEPGADLLPTNLAKGQLPFCEAKELIKIAVLVIACTRATTTMPSSSLFHIRITCGIAVGIELLPFLLAFCLQWDRHPSENRSRLLLSSRTTSLGCRRTAGGISNGTRVSEVDVGSQRKRNLCRFWLVRILIYEKKNEIKYKRTMWNFIYMGKGMRWKEEIPLFGVHGSTGIVAWLELFSARKSFKNKGSLHTEIWLLEFVVH